MHAVRTQWLGKYALALVSAMLWVAALSGFLARKGDVTGLAGTLVQAAVVVSVVLSFISVVIAASTAFREDGGRSYAFMVSAALMIFGIALAFQVFGSPANPLQLLNYPLGA